MHLTLLMSLAGGGRGVECTTGTVDGQRSLADFPETILTGSTPTAAFGITWVAGAWSRWGVANSSSSRSSDSGGTRGLVMSGTVPSRYAASRRSASSRRAALRWCYSEFSSPPGVTSSSAYDVTFGLRRHARAMAPSASLREGHRSVGSSPTNDRWVAPMSPRLVEIAAAGRGLPQRPLHWHHHAAATTTPSDTTQRDGFFVSSASAPRRQTSSSRQYWRNHTNPSRGLSRAVPSCGRMTRSDHVSALLLGGNISRQHVACWGQAFCSEPYVACWDRRCL